MEGTQPIKQENFNEHHWSTQWDHKPTICSTVIEKRMKEKELTTSSRTFSPTI